MALRVSLLEDARAGLPAQLALLERWVAQDGATGHPALVAAMGRLLAEDLAGLGFDVELVDGAVWATLDGGGSSRVTLIGHHDTVFAPGAPAARGFSVAGGRAVGPGVADMKGGLLVGALAPTLLRGRFGRVQLVSLPDEETREWAFAGLDRLAGSDAVLCLECGRPGGAVVSARKGGRWLRMAAAGRSAHAGVAPERGRNAVVALAREAVRVGGLTDARDGLTVTVTRLHGGDAVNTVPGSATLDVDIRAQTTADLEWAEREIRRIGRHDGVTVEIAARPGFPPLERTPAVADLARAAREAGRELGLEVGEVATGGVSDACWTAAAGLPTLDGLGPVGDLDHTDAEYIEVDSLPERIALVAGLIERIEAQ